MSAKGYFEKRKWGSFEILDTRKNFKVKRLVIDPGKATSLQYHLHRDEYWRVVTSKASVVRNDRSFELGENQGIFVPKSMLHQIRNGAESELVIIEIQFGDYLEEDDIIRVC
jgi:mannose-6-phosphate isomerase-like protein (cupin superfamily)